MTLETLLKRQQSLVDAAKAEGRELTIAENTEFDNLQKQIDGLRAASPNDGKDDKSQERAIGAERARISEIVTVCRDFSLEPDAYIKDGSTVDAVMRAALDKLRKENAPVSVQVTKDEGDKFRSAAADSILMRGGVAVSKPADGAAELRNLSLRDLVIECQAREGKSHAELLRMSNDDLYNAAARQFFNPADAFSAIMDTAVRKNIVEAYTTIPTTFEAWVREGSVNDFKPTPDHEYAMGGLGDFERVPENGELKNDTPSFELLPSRQVHTYGKQFSMSRQAFINDDIGFVTVIPARYAARAKQTINSQVYKLLYDNPAIYDGVALFHANHKNLIASGAAPSSATIQAAILRMQKQTDHFGRAISMKPAFLIVPVGYGFTLQTLFASPTINTTDNTQSVNPLYNYPITVVEEPELNVLASANAVPWFLVADHNSAKSVQVDYLRGQKVPQMRRSEAPGYLGFVWDFWLDWGVTVADFRGIVKNPGAVIS